MSDIEKKILQMEFQHKKDMVELDRKLQSISDLQDRTQRQLDFITQLTGFAYQEVNDINDRIEQASKILPKK